MVRPITKYTGLSLVGLLCLSVIVFGVLVGTQSGSRWLLSQLQGLSPVKLHFTLSEGRLADHLVLHDLELSWHNGALKIEEVEVGWSLWRLPFQQLDIDRLNLKNPTYLSLQTTAESQQKELPPWPELPDGLSSWQVNIAQLFLSQATYISQEQEEPYVFDAEGHDLHLKNGVVSSKNLQVTYLDYTSEGQLVLNLHTPGVQGDVTLSSRKTRDELYLYLDLKDKSPEHLLNGTLSGHINTGKWPVHHFRSDLLLDSNRLALVGIKIEQTDTDGLISGELGLSWQEKTAINAFLNVKQWPIVLQQETIALDGSLRVSGPLDSIHGQYDLVAAGPEMLSGSLSGDLEFAADEARIDIRHGRWLGSEFTATIQSPLPQPEVLKADIQMRGLDPARIATKWSGRVNLNAAVVVSLVNDEPQVDFDAQFFDSQLMGLPLRGFARGFWEGNTLSIDQADFSGEGIHLSAKGSLDKRLDVDFEISALAALLPEIQGQLSGRGWIGLSDGEWFGDLSSSGTNLQFDKLSAEAFSFSFARQNDNLPADINLKIQMLKYGTISLQSTQAIISGDKSNQEMAVWLSFPDGSARVSAFGGITEDGWQGTIKTVDIKHVEFDDWQLESPATVRFDKQGYSFDAFSLVSDNGRLSLAGGLQRNGQPRQLKAHLEGFPLQLISMFIDPVLLTGDLEMALECDSLYCQMEMSGVKSIKHKEGSVKIDAMSLDGTWDQHGFNSLLEVKLPGEASLSGRLSSKGPLQSYTLLPLQWDFDWHKLPLSPLVKLPGNIILSGTWQGHSTGVLTSKTAFSAEFQASLEDTVLAWNDEHSGSVEFLLDGAEVDGVWQDNQLVGSMNLVIAEHGQLSSSWRLPVPARWPIEPITPGRVSGHLGGYYKEKGLIGVFWPEIVQNTQGDIEIDTELAGTWVNPEISGELSLKDGQAHIPTSGITFENIEINTQFNDDRVVIEKLTGVSAPGELSATGRIDLQKWIPEKISLEISGHDFTLIDLPELRLRANPNLVLTGAKKDFHLSGKIEVPYFLAVGRSGRSPVQTSPDAVIVGQQTAAAEKELPFNLKTNIELILGEQVLVDMFGLNARLGGQLQLTDIDRTHFTGAGLIEVLEGTYSTYGVKLRIDKGQANYAHGPLDNPALNILALRDVGETKAGVRISGTAKSPQVKLYSEPGMPDTEILSLIVLGRPLGQAGGETDPLMLAAGALLSASDSAVLRNRLQSQLGLDTLAAESEAGETNDTILRLGKYLTPDLYLSYGYALFGQRSEVGLRYRIYEGWEAESNFGLESGADIYYRFEFD
jgi:translocation and assembly module TamB